MVRVGLCLSGTHIMNVAVHCRQVPHSVSNFTNTHDAILRKVAETVSLQLQVCLDKPERSGVRKVSSS